MTRRINLVELHPAQDEVFNDNTRFRVVVAGRRWGKTTLSKVIALQKASAKKRAKVWYVAPTYGMAREIMWNELKRFIPKEWVAKYHETLLTITLVNGSLLSLKGADDPDRLRGVGLDFIICDEFQDMRPDTWETVLRPTLSTTQGGALFIGTPKSFNQLYKLYQKGMAQKRSSVRSLEGNRGGESRLGSEDLPSGIRGALRVDVGPRLLPVRSQDPHG
jgi:phage terminase large subunit-like protein